MSWHLPWTQSAGQTGHESHQNHTSSYQKPGKFPDISNFMNITNEYQLDYEPGTFAAIDPGHIIYIRDDPARDTRINDRVMLVLFHNPPSSYTCLSFCYHPNFSGATLHECHAVVNTVQQPLTPPPDAPPNPSPEPAQAPQPTTSLTPLEVALRYKGTSFSPQPHIYLNCREHWNVEREVQLVILGEVEKNSFGRLKPAISRIFNQSLNGNVRDRENSPTPDAPQVVVVEKKHGSRRDRGYQRKKSQ